MSQYRVPDRGRIDRNDPISFNFDGRTYQGYRGDTVASALLANGVHLVGRSFKYHRPRGIVSAGSEDPNALIQTSRSGSDRREPNTRATMQELREDLTTQSQNRWPSLGFDLGAVNSLAAPLFSAGFYYKTFMWPKSFWDRLYEPVIRAAAGLGQAPAEPDPDHYANQFAHTDLLVIGGGIAGIAAALTAARAGVPVMLVDEHADIGGALLSAPDVEIEDVAAWDWIAQSLSELRELGATLLPRTTAIGYYHQNMIGLCERLSDHLDAPDPNLPRERFWQVRAKQVVLAQGAIEKPLVFKGNDRPGVMLAGAAQTYLHRFGVLVGHRPAIATCHDSAWQAAFDLADAGAEIAVISDLRPRVSPHLRKEAERRSIPVRLGQRVTRVEGRLRATHLGLAGGTDDKTTLIPCDCVLNSGGWTPSLHLFSHTKSSLSWDGSNGTYLPGETLEDCEIAGASRGLWGYGAALADGAEAGARAAKALGHATKGMNAKIQPDPAQTGTAQSDFDAPDPKGFVDFQNDVMAKDVRLAVREGMRSIEHIKRYTTTGMATDQGKLSNINALHIAADALEKQPPAVGLTTFRPPYSPTSFGAFCGFRRGDLFEVTRKTPIDGWAEENGAEFEPVGQWRRAWYFPHEGEDIHAATARECAAIRASLGMFDASTLGKIEVIGPDATEFMNRVYTNPWTKLAPGRCRYGLLLGEDGFIRDDGVIGRLSETHFHITTTTGGAASVLNMMEDYLQTEWPDLKVWLTSISEEWAAIALNGPNARRLIEPFVEGLDISEDAFPHMSLAQCRFDGLPCRLFRVSFTGELGFEINVPAAHGRAVWEKLYEAGQAYDICPYGTETMHILRAEKGYIIVGQDTDGTVTPMDAGLNWAIGKNKPDFIGKRSLARPDMGDDQRKQLVGLLPLDDGPPFEEGAQIVFEKDAAIPMHMRGHVTSSYHSAILDHPIALALIEGGHNRMEQEVYLPMPDGVRRAKITSTVFYDPENVRLKGEVS